MYKIQDMVKQLWYIHPKQFYIAIQDCISRNMKQKGNDHKEELSEEVHQTK